MDQPVAVWADEPEVVEARPFAGAEVAHRAQVMGLDEVTARFPVAGLEVEVARFTRERARCVPYLAALALDILVAFAATVRHDDDA